MKTVEYTLPQEEISYGELMSVAEFRASVKCGAFIDYDGYGHPIKDGMAAGDVNVRPSRMDLLPEDATHIMWFNR